MGPLVLGSMFGSTHGFTQLGAMGKACEIVRLFATPDGLKASAVADADIVTCVLPQMRAKKTGRSVLVTVTVTHGLDTCCSITQGLLPFPLKFTVTSDDNRFLPPTELLIATWVATGLARFCCAAVSIPSPGVFKSDVAPEFASTRAPASAAASAASCASLRAV